MNALIYIILSFIISVNGNVLQNCIIGPEGKCLRMEENDINSTPNPDAKLLLEINLPNKTICFSQCSANLSCFMAAYRIKDKSCFMYGNISFSDTVDQTYLLFFWRCCNTNMSYPAPNRCHGFWKIKENYVSFNEKRINDPLLIIPNTNVFNCQQKCLENQICGSINVETSEISAKISCELIIEYPVENFNMAPRLDWHAYIWQCASNYTLPIPSKDCTLRKNDETGYFLFENSSITMYKNMQTILYFHTHNVEACLYNCVQYEHCQRVWYSLKSLFCMLESDNKSSCTDTQTSNDYSFTTYIWKNCSSIIETKIDNSDNYNCRKILNNQYMYIHHSKCGSIPENVNNMYPCSTPIIFDSLLLFYENFHCQINQSFKTLRTIDASISDLYQFSNMSLIRVYTGYESFWLANVSSIDFPESQKSECSIYNANMEFKASSDLNIISRQGWFAKMSTGPESNFPDFPVPFVIITDTERPFCNCFTIEACSYHIRVIQDLVSPKFVAIPYNFIITGDGMVYESKGWTYENQGVGGQYNSKSMSIALCGRYHKEPGIKSLNSLKKLINLSIKNKKVSENYTLLLLRDVGLGFPFEGLTRVIELWPHYRGHIASSCSVISIWVIIFNILLSFLIIGLILLFIHFGVLRLRHNEYCKIVKNCRIHRIYGNLNKKPQEIFPQIYLYHFNYLTKENIFISSYTTSLFWIENKNEIKDNDSHDSKCQCQSAVFAIFNLCRLQSNLLNINSLAIMPELKTCSRKIGFILDRHSELDNQIILILHCNKFRSFDQFINRLYTNQCVCDLYNLVRYNPESGPILLDYRFFEDPTYTEVKNHCNRFDMEKQHCFLYDENKCLRFYK